MKILDPRKVFVQYRDDMNPYEPIMERKYTITHSDLTADLFVFIASNYAEDQISKTRDEVRIAWEEAPKGLMLVGSVLVDDINIEGISSIRNRIFYHEMPTALQALRQADRFLFINRPELDKTPVFIHFISNDPEFYRIYRFGEIGNFQ
ncbi:staygreen family protein [Anaerotignum sp.]|uniref:staygreen family protein n=1 Tax=Anaerotignum sp. TaxID=2039241 RepID=UPI003327E00B